MRICLVSQEYPPDTARGGIGSQTYLKARGLTSLGHEVTVVSVSTDGLRHETTDRGVRVVRIPGYYHRIPVLTEPAAWVTYSSEVAATVFEIHQNCPFDLVDFPEYGGEGYVFLLNQPEGASVPTTVQIHGPLVMLSNTVGWPEKGSELYRVGTHMESTCLRLATGVYSSSLCSLEWCRREYGLTLESAPILHAGVDLETFFPREKRPGSPPTIIFVGRVDRHKGADILVRAACRVAREIPDLRVLLIGRVQPKFESELSEIARSHGCPDLLRVLGSVPHEELPALISEGHVFAAPSLYEGGPGLVYFEAMACGLPVIGCRGSGASEAIVDGETGFLVDPESEDSLKTALHRILSDDRVRGRMAVQSLAHARRAADSRQCVRRISDYYQLVTQNATAGVG